MHGLCLCAAVNAENGTSKRRSQSTKCRSAQKSSSVLRQRKKNKNKTASQDSSSVSEKSSAVQNVTVLTPPAAMSLRQTLSVHEPCDKTLSSGIAAVTDSAAAAAVPAVPAVVNSPDPNENMNSEAASTAIAGGNDLCCHIVSDNVDAINEQCNNDKETLSLSVDNRAASGIMTVPEQQQSGDQLNRSAEVDNVVITEAGGSLSAVDAVNISDGSLHLDTQVLCAAVAGPAESDGNKVTNIVQPATETVPTGDQVMSENLFETSFELDALGTATCQFMKEFSTQKCAAQTNAAVSKHSGASDEINGCVVSVHDPQTDLSVCVTSELVAASNFDRIHAASDNGIHGQIAYSEEMLFDDGDQCVQAQSRLTDNLPKTNKQIYQLSTGLNNGITSDSAEKLVADDCIENKSDLFASYIEEPDTAIRADVCPTDLPAENTFSLAHDSLTCTMLDRAMAVITEATVGNQLGTGKCPLVAAADAKQSSDADANVVVVNEPRSSQTEHTAISLNNAEPPDIDAEAALHLLCESSQKATKKPPKRKGRKRTSDRADLSCKSGTHSDQEKRRRTLNHSPHLPPDSDRADVNLNKAVCGATSFTVSFGSTSDSSAYIPPTPPSTANEKSTVNTPRRLLGGVTGVTPVKSDNSAPTVSKLSKNILQSESYNEKQLIQHEANGKTEAVSQGSEVKINCSSPPATQDLPSSQSFTIIDVAANRQLFDTFMAEWQQQVHFSLALACEKRPKPRSQHLQQSSEAIGAKFTRGN